MPPATEAVLVNVPSPTGVVLVHDDQPTDAADDRADA